MTFSSYEEFWPYYVAMHSRAATRWVHLTGTLTGLAVTAYGLARGRKRYARRAAADRLRDGLARALPHREEQSGHLRASGLVAARGRPDDPDDAGRAGTRSWPRSPRKWLAENR